MDYINVYKLRS